MVFAYAHPDDPYDVNWLKFEEVFAPPQTAQMRFWRFQTREQLAGETVRLGREAYSPDGRQAPLLHQFSVGLQDNTVVAKVARNPPQTIEEALISARQC